MNIEVSQSTTRERVEHGTSRSMRQCAGCAKACPAEDLVRVVLGPVRETITDGATGGGPSGVAGRGGLALAVDLGHSHFGRGAHVHASPLCVQKALRGGFSRVLKTKVEGALGDFAAQVVVAAHRRIEGLLLGARRARHAVSGADVVSAAIRDGSARLVVVATDAAAALKVSEIENAMREGKAIAWSHKVHLGTLFGRDEVAVCAVLHEGVADAIGRARSQMAAFEEAARTRSEAWSASEDR